MANTPTIQIGQWKIVGIWATFLIAGVSAVAAYFIALHPPTFQNWPLWISALIWIIFIGYWSRAAKNSSAARKSEARESRAIHELLLNVSLVLLFVSIPGLHLRFVPASRAVALAGLAVQSGFFGLALWARRHLGRHWSGRITIKEGHELIRSGPYRLVRHPIYTAMIGMYLGTAIVSGEIPALLAVAIVLFAYARKIRIEEAVLAEAFGPKYADYRSRSWALAPLIF